MLTRRWARRDAGMRVKILFFIVFARVVIARASPTSVLLRENEGASLVPASEDAPAPVVVPFEPCVGATADVDAFCAKIGLGCEITDARATRGRDGATLEDGCVAVLVDAKVGVARATVSRTCAGRAREALWIRATMMCEEEQGRLFPYSTMLLGEVVALADAAIYLANSTHALKETIRGNETTEDDAEEEKEEERGASFTIYYPWSY